MLFVVCVYVTAQCRTVLGMQTGEIPDGALSASSSKAEDLGPTSARSVIPFGQLYEMG